MKRLRWAAALGVVALSALGTAPSASAAGDAAAGQKVFSIFCAVCHSTKEGVNMVGPSLNKVYGRKAGSIPGFKYSPAVLNSGIVWNDETLDKWLTNPQAEIPGNRMPFAGISDAQKRASVIEYLKTLQ
ncbi:MAG TPA: c-type cytochrome [Parvularculaceae bacterium]|nr:c-type cytochrome [Parvularculaceae bacterium]